MPESTTQMTAGRGGPDGSSARGPGPRAWVVVVVACAGVAGVLVLAFVIFLVAGSGDRGGSSTAATADSSRWLAYTASSGTDLARLDLGPGGEAVPLNLSMTPDLQDTYTFRSADDVKVRVSTTTLYNEGWDDDEQLAGLVQEYRDQYLVECEGPKTTGGDPTPLPAATATIGPHLRATVTCAPRTGQEPGIHELYAFTLEPVRTNSENVARTWVLVAASAEEPDKVGPVLERAVATLGLGSDLAAAETGSGPVPPDPGPARNKYPTDIWDDTKAFFFPAGWSVVGAGGFNVVAPEKADVDAVRSYASPGIVLARNDPKPGGRQTSATLSDSLVGDYSQIAEGNGCTQRTDLEPSGNATAEIRWTGCPNALVDRVAVHADDSGGVILVSVRASDEQAAEDLVGSLGG